MCQDLSSLYKVTRTSEVELWEYLIAHDEVEDFNNWVKQYREEINN